MDVPTLTVAGLIAAIVAATINLIFKMVEKNLENQRQNMLKAEIVAELLAEWQHKPTDYKKLRTLTYQAFLWLPDEIAKDLSDLLAHEPNRKDVRDILVAVRRQFLPDSELPAREIIVFPDFQGTKSELYASNGNFTQSGEKQE